MGVLDNPTTSQCFWDWFRFAAFVDTAITTPKSQRDHLAIDEQQGKG
jgi:hypothetical protein